MKICYKCKKEQPLNLFHKQKAGKYGVTSICKICKKEEYKEYGALYRKKNPYDPRKDKNNKLKYAYGITIEIYEEILEKQNWVCAICGTDGNEKKYNFHVDHCHKTGKVRGLLCSNCNSGIGNLRDSVDLLEKSIEYLKNFESVALG